jgi:UPF0716 protein FxsA
MRIVIMVLPWLELFTLIQLGIKTSAFTAIVYVFATALVGLVLLQRQGRGLFEKLMQGRAGILPGPEVLLDELGMAFAGLLLLFPGMITDGIAVLVLIGPLRRRIFRAFRRSQSVDTPRSGDWGQRETIEGEYRRLDE